MAVVTQWSPATQALQAWDAFCKPFPTESWYDCGLIVLVAWWDFDGAWYCPWLKPGYFILIPVCLKKTDDFLGSCVEKREPCGMVKIYHPLHSYPCCDFVGFRPLPVKLQIRKSFAKNPQHEGSSNGVHQGSLYDTINPKQCTIFFGKSLKKSYHRFVWSLIDPSPTLGSQWNDLCRPREAILMGWIHQTLRMPKGWQPGNLPVNVSTLWAKARLEMAYFLPGKLKGYL